MPPSKELANVLRVVAFVETDVLLLAVGRLRTFDRKTVEGRLQEFDVVRVSAAHLDAPNPTRVRMPPGVRHCNSDDRKRLDAGRCAGETG